MISLLRKLTAALLIPVILASALGVFSEASEYTRDWKTWNQRQSDYEDMKQYGCVVVAMAIMLKDCGVAPKKGFNPDVFMQWEIDHGYLDPEEFLQSGFRVPQYYARSRRYKLKYEGNSYDVYNKVMSNIRSGYYSIICVSTGRGRHYCLVDNERTTADDIYCLNTGVKGAHYLSEFALSAVQVHTYIPEKTPSMPECREPQSSRKLPDAPGKAAESVNEVLGITRTEISWEPAQGADSYVYMLKRNSGGKTEILLSGRTESCSVTLPDTEDGSLVFSVCSVNTAGTSRAEVLGIEREVIPSAETAFGTELFADAPVRTSNSMWNYLKALESRPSEEIAEEEADTLSATK